MEPREAYRIQLSWDGSRFVLYLRGLLSGVLDSPIGLWDTPHPTKRTILNLPVGRQEVTTYVVGPGELVAGLSHWYHVHPFGRDAEWAKGLLQWILSLYAAEGWYPDVRQERVTLRLLIDSVEATQQLHHFRDSMPPSFRAATPPGQKSEAWPSVLESLGDAVGWALLRQDPVPLKSASLKRLPAAYADLLQTLADGQRQAPSAVTFFDPRQANLSLPRRSSRLAFLIAPPDRDHPHWQLRPQLQSLKNNAVSCDALAGWQNPQMMPSELFTPGTSPRFHLLREFGRALRVYPDLGASLASSPPSALQFDDDQMAQFLKTQAESLQAFGYPLLAPEGLARPNTPQVSLRIDPGVDGRQGGLDIGQLLDFDWNLAVDETLLNPDDLLAWAENPTPLLLSQGRWYWVDTKTTLKAMRFVEKQSSRGTLLEAMTLAGGAQPLRLEFAGQLSPLNANERFEERCEPEGFRGTLRAYQRRGYSWLLFMRRLGLGACLADDMGLGKTVQTLAALQSLKNQNQLRLALLICPTSVLGNWLQEAAKFTPDLRVMLHHGQRIKDPDLFYEEVQKCDLIITSYPLLTRDRKSFLAPDWDVVILDEAQQIKNSQTQSSKVARDLKASSKILLTGTPVENRLEDLWSLFRFLQPEVLDSRRSFQSRFARPIENRGDADAKEHLRQLVGPFILRRTKTDPLVAPELPSKLETLVACALTPEQAKIYDSEVETALHQIEGARGIQRRGAILKLLTRLKQLCDHPALLEKDGDWSHSRSGKLHRLFEILEELPKQEGVLIFSQFSRMVRRLQSVLTGHLNEEVLAFDGATPRASRDQMVARYQSGRGPRLFAISLKSGGVGLNLTRASTVVHFDRWWNPAVEMQATDRAFRIGQERNVQVFKFSTQGTLEEQIDRILEEKRTLVTGLIEDGDSWLTELDDNELARLLRPNQKGDKR